ncbi:MAG: MFS transporter [Actinomycetia bacterium]|nr:MFS transporter [Actinomycetes bacterium]
MRRSPRTILLAIGFGVFVAADDLTVVTTMLRPIIGDIGLILPDDLDEAAWIVNAYLIAFVAVMPLAGRLSDRFGRRAVFTAGYTVFLVGTTVIPLASSLGPFLVGRVLTAVGGGAMLPVALAVVGDIFPPEERARALGTLGAIETLGWVWGPLYGAALVRFLSWQWQFWLNIPLAIAGLLLAWWALAEESDSEAASPVDWIGALSLTGALITLSVALLGNAEVQSVSGLDELAGTSSADFRWFYPVAVALLVLFGWRQKKAPVNLFDATSTSRPVWAALGVNGIVGTGLVITMVDVPLYVNTAESNVKEAAVIAGFLLAALTISMTVASYLGGRLSERAGATVPTLAGLVLAVVAFVAMGLSWDDAVRYPLMAGHLALLGCGLGLVFAPTTGVVVDSAAPDQRGSAAAVVMAVRLVGFSIGLAGLTAYGLARFDALRSRVDLPAITDPGFGGAVREAQAEVTATAIAETFLLAALVTALAGLSALALSSRPIIDEVLIDTDPVR